MVPRHRLLSKRTDAIVSPGGLGRVIVVAGGVDFPLLDCFCGLSERDAGEGAPFRKAVWGARIRPLLFVRACPVGREIVTGLDFGAGQ